MMDKKFHLIINQKNMSDSQFYPSLKNLIDANKIRSSIIQQTISKHFQINENGDSLSLKINVISFRQFGIDILGAKGMKLLVNPSNLGTETSIEISLNVNLEILKYFKKFDLQKFSFQPIDFFDLVCRLTQINDVTLLEEFIKNFIGGNNSIEDFVNRFNTLFPEVITIPSNVNPYINLSEQIKAQNLKIRNVVISILLDSSEFENIEDFVKSLVSIFQRWIKGFNLRKISDLLTPKIEASLPNLSLAIQFPRSIFIPLETEDNYDLNTEVNEILPEPFMSLLTFNVGSLHYSNQNGFSFDQESSFNFHPSQILQSGFTLSVNNLKIDLSRTKNIPEAIADGRPSDFIGVYIQDATIGFPAFWNHDESNSTGVIKARNLLVGTGGMSGTIGLEAKTAGNPSPLISANFGGGFKVSLDAFSLTFQQNSIIESNIRGTMKIPGFKDTLGNDAEINIDVWIGTNGEFSVTASEDQSITALRIPNILDFNISSLSVGRKQDRFFVAISGAVDFMDQGGTVGKFLPDKIDIKKLIVWQDGQVEFEGGTLVLPQAITLKVKPVELSITAIGFGSHQQEHNGILRKYKFFEFSGGISINPGGVDARGDGIKFYFTVDDNEVGQSKHVFVRIQGIGIDIIIPGNAKPEDAALLLSGYLAMKDPAPGNEAAGTEYAGGIDFKLPKLKMGGSAAMRLNPKVPAFIVDIGLELSTPIPLGATGLGIYGFRALLGQRYLVSKTAAGVAEDGEWWQYYKAKIAPDYKEGVQVSKFAQTNGFSLGAGVSLATSTDSGRTFSSKIFFLLSLPEVFLLQGQGQILKERIGLDTTTDPPFFAMIAVSKQSVEAAFGVNLKIPDDKRPGSIATVDALIEMGFFFGNASAWYLNIGRDLPESRRVNVRLLELFDAYFYFMIASSGIKAGAGAKFEIEEKFGPLRAELGAYLDVAGKIAFKPKQYGASIQMGGHVGLYIFKFGFKITVHAGLAAEAPKPFIVTGSLKVCVTILKKERCAKFEFTWIKDNTPDLSEIAIMNLPVAASAVNMMTKDVFRVLPTAQNLASISPSAFDNYIVPMDSFIDLEFMKGVLPSENVRNKFGGNTQGAKFVDYVSPQKSKSARVRHEFHLKDIKIHAWNGSGWQEFDIYSAATPLADADFVVTDLSTLKSGYWQYQQAGLHNKLRIMAQSPLSFMSQGSGQIGDLVMEDVGITAETILCPPEPISKTCIDFNDLGKGSEPGDIVLSIPADQVIFYQHFLFRINGGDANIVNNPYGSFINGLALRDNDELEIVFTEPMSLVSFRLQSVAPNIIIEYYQRVQLEDFAPTNLPQFEYVLVESRTIQSADLVDPVIYSDLETPIEKVLLKACECVTPEPDIPFVCDADITQQAKDLEVFLLILAKNRHLTVPINLYPEHNLVYHGVFQSTSLYPPVTEKSTVIQSFPDPISANSITINLKDNFGYECSIILNSEFLLDSWDVIVGFENIRPFNTVPGVNYEFEIDAILSNGSTITITGRSCYPIIECYGDCTTFVYQFCFLPFDDALYNSTLPDSSGVQSEIDSLIAGFNGSIQPVWRPNTTYAIEVNVEDKLYQDSSSTLHTSFDRKHVFGFKTVGPVGNFHLNVPQYTALQNLDREAEFKLASLQHYVDFRKSYPNADGALINSKPLFYVNPKLLLFYVKNYVYEFYRNWDVYNGNSEVQISMETLILDPAPDTSLPEAAPIQVQWLPNNLPGFNLDVFTLNNMIENSEPCVESEAITPIGVNSLVDIDQLEPLKLYTAIFKAKYEANGGSVITEEEVHRYVFQTSRYASFEEQVMSYILETDPENSNTIIKEALFEVNLELDSVSIDLVGDILSDTLAEDSSLRIEFAHPYDRLMGVLKMSTLHPAVTTEINVVRNSTSGDVIGILVRNPEPFNDPKIPLNAELLNSIQINNGSLDLDKKIFSKDYRDVFLSVSNLQIPQGSFDTSFNYLQWNGGAYEVVSNASLTFTIS
jgi:hypothetical protein